MSHKVDPGEVFHDYESEQARKKVPPKQKREYVLLDEGDCIRTPVFMPDHSQQNHFTNIPLLKYTPPAPERPRPNPCVPANPIPLITRMPAMRLPHAKGRSGRRR